MKDKTKKEKIKYAAIKFEDKIYTGFHHRNIMDEVWLDWPGQEVTQEMQGFVTNTGRFVNRTEAANIAFNAGQIRGGINSLDSYQIF